MFEPFMPAIAARQLYHDNDHGEDRLSAAPLPPYLGIRYIPLANAASAATHVKVQLIHRL